MITILYQKGRCLLVFKIGFYEQKNIRVNQFTIHNSQLVGLLEFIGVIGVVGRVGLVGRRRTEEHKGRRFNQCTVHNSSQAKR